MRERKKITVREHAGRGERGSSRIQQEVVGGRWSSAQYYNAMEEEDFGNGKGVSEIRG